MESKKDIRKCVLEKRSQMTDKEWDDKSHIIFEKVVSHPFFFATDTVYCYVDYRREVGTRKIIEEAWKQQKKVAVPRVEGTEMNFYYIRQFDDLTEGYRRIPEPKATLPACEENPLVIMPGAAFDCNRNRIGYGKAFYDKFLSAHPGCRTMAIAFELQIVNQIPADEYDICPEILVTEEHIYDK